jgi:PPOX class probable F420-dependent enzyme
MSQTIPPTHYDLLDEPVVAMLATLMDDGQPQVTPVWCDRHGNQIWVNSAAGRQKDLNMRRNKRVTIAALDPTNPYRYLEVRGHVVEIVEGQPAFDHIHKLAHDYFGRPFKFNKPGEQRVLYKIEPLHVNAGG